MAHRSRNQKVKADVAGSGFLSHIPTAGMIPERWSALYYRLLHDMGFPALSETEPDRGVIAWLIATTMVRIVEATDKSDVANEVDLKMKLHDREKLPALTKELISLVSAFRKRKDEKPNDEDAPDLQAELNRLMDGGNNTKQTD